jgi:hypothetical protein
MKIRRGITNFTNCECGKRFPVSNNRDFFMKIIILSIFVVGGCYAMYCSGVDIAIEDKGLAGMQWGILSIACGVWAKIFMKMVEDDK